MEAPGDFATTLSAIELAEENIGKKVDRLPSGKIIRHPDLKQEVTFRLCVNGQESRSCQQWLDRMKVMMVR